jgi:hypothetical protein
MQTTRQQSAILKFEWAAIISAASDVDPQSMWNKQFFVKLLHCLASHTTVSESSVCQSQEHAIFPG